MEFAQELGRTIVSFFRWLTPIFIPRLRWSTQYLLSDTHIYHPEMKIVPPNAIYVDEYVDDGVSKARVTYAGNPIVSNYTEDPFDTVILPWIWIGDKTTETDITPQISRFLVQNNEIRLELLKVFLPMIETPRIVYLDTSLVEHDFPSEGMIIKRAE